MEIRGLVVQLIGIFLLPRLISGQDSCPSDDGPVVVCYYASWAIYRPGNGTHKIEYLNPKLCTHLIYSFAGLSLEGLIGSLDSPNDIASGGYGRFTQLKETNPCLKTLLAIGGWSEGSEKYSLMAERPETRQRFADSVLRFLCHFNFDGLDLDWEYPTQRGGIAEDKQNLLELLKCLRDTFRKRQKLLTVAIGITPWIIETGYGEGVQEMCDTVDLVMTMAYDLQDPTRISVHAPLKREADEEEETSHVTIDDGIRLLKSSSCDPNKIVLGIAAYGRSFTMKSSSGFQIGQPVAGQGKAGPYLREAGSLGFNEICEELSGAGGKWTVTQLDGNAISYAYKDKQWVSFDDVDSIGRKAAYAVEERLRGLMLYSVDTDDFHGHCLGKSYPLLRAINKGLGRAVVQEGEVKAEEE